MTRPVRNLTDRESEAVSARAFGRVVRVGAGLSSAIIRTENAAWIMTRREAVELRDMLAAALGGRGYKRGAAARKVEQ